MGFSTLVSSFFLKEMGCSFEPGSLQAPRGLMLLLREQTFSPSVVSTVSPLFIRPSAQLKGQLADKTESETASMLIMMYAYARFSGDGNLLSQHVSFCASISKTETQYLSVVCGGEALGRLPGEHDEDTVLGFPVRKRISPLSTHS